MEQLIADHRPFTKDLWHGGDTSAPLITTATNDEDQPKSKKIKPEAPPKNAKPVTKKVLKPRKTSKKKDTVRKQRRISSYFHAASSSRISNDKILELLTAISDQVSKLQKESKLLRKLLKRKKTTTSFKRSAFNTLLGEGLVKKGKTAFAHKGCQTEPTNDNVPVSSHDVPLTVRLTYIIFWFSSTCHSRKLLWRKITFSRPSSANTLHSVTAQFLTASQQPPPPSTPPPSTSPIHTSPIHTSPIHTSPNPHFPHPHLTHPHLPHTSPSTSPIHISPIHISPIHTSPIHISPICTSPNSILNTPPFATNPTTPPSLRPLSPIYDASAHPNNSPIAISPEPPSLSQPRYDTSCNQSSQKRNFPLSPLHLTPETSPKKGSDSLPGFVGHASTINAFSATATSKPSSAAKTKHSSAQQAQPTEDSDVVSLSDSDGSPAPKRPKHIPSIEENHLAKQLERCKTVPAPDLISPLSQIEWDLFEKIISKSSAAFHITPSKLDFSNNFLLQLAQPMKWTTTYHMEILMHMLAARQYPRHSTSQERGIPSNGMSS
ncbi:hypothetical protein IGI04_019936 [Brassica rapa subsp. trilocularis]|uniref:Uncharacterized protein n=1 Tax=Brassica rapa subsp. trilocularis TaxID=1813537 RepID=A0ABQ7MHB8_BRACM|nr:hypothetical protein IGI04_019936 [Brassica rapa subsp. trilocularis]